MAHACRSKRAQSRAADEWTVRELRLIEQHDGRMKALIEHDLLKVSSQSFNKPTSY
jgi:hypothetical protein